MNSSELMRVAGAMVARGKGILAADESGGTIKKRFDGIKLESTEEHRRTYREMLFTAPGAAESEEHTSELQSRFDIVCRILLEKKITIRGCCINWTVESMRDYSSPRPSNPSCRSFLRFVGASSTAAVFAAGSPAANTTASHMCS